MTSIRKLVGGNRPHDVVELALMWGFVAFGVVLELRLVSGFLVTIHDAVIQGGPGL